MLWACAEVIAPKATIMAPMEAARGCGFFMGLGGFELEIGIRTRRRMPTKFTRILSIAHSPSNFLLRGLEIFSHRFAPRKSKQFRRVFIDVGRVPLLHRIGSFIARTLSTLVQLCRCVRPRNITKQQRRSNSRSDRRKNRDTFSSSSPPGARFERKRKRKRISKTIYPMKIAVLLTSLAIALIQPATPACAAEAKRPNILVIVADDLGYGELGVQGNPEIPTPHIDSLAKNGIRFTNGYVTGPYCSPTRAALLTGRYQQRFGHEFNSGPVVAAADNFGLPLTEKTLGDRLKAAGYATGWFGKSHMGFKPEFHPQKRGFDEFFGFLGAAHSYLENGKGRNAILDGTAPASDIDHTTEAFARRAVAFIEKHRDEPWLVYLPFNAVHGPLEATTRYLERFNQISDPKRRSFAAMLSALDDAVGSVLAKLAELKAEEDTLIFFFSDNGGPTRQTTSSNGPLRGFKATTWEGGIRVPWIAQWKGHLPAGKVDDRPVVQMYILPTALAAAGVEVQSDWKLDGVNLLPFLTGANSERPHETLYWRFGQQLAIRKGDWKLVKAPGAGLEAAEPRAGANIEGAQLFDLSKDIGEKNNLATSQPEKVKELAATWQEWNRQLADPKWVPEKAKAAAKKKRPRAAQSQSPSAPASPPAADPIAK